MHYAYVDGALRSTISLQRTKESVVMAERAGRVQRIPCKKNEEMNRALPLLQNDPRVARVGAYKQSEGNG